MNVESFQNATGFKIGLPKWFSGKYFVWSLDGYKLLHLHRSLLLMAAHGGKPKYWMRFYPPQVLKITNASEPAYVVEFRPARHWNRMDFAVFLGEYRIVNADRTPLASIHVSYAHEEKIQYSKFANVLVKVECPGVDGYVTMNYDPYESRVIVRNSRAEEISPPPFDTRSRQMDVRGFQSYFPDNAVVMTLGLLGFALCKHEARRHQHI